MPAFTTHQTNRSGSPNPKPPTLQINQTHMPASYHGSLIPHTTTAGMMVARGRRNLNSAVVRTEPIQLLQKQYQISNLYTTSAGADFPTNDEAFSSRQLHGAHISNEPSFLDFREGEGMNSLPKGGVKNNKRQTRILRQK